MAGVGKTQADELLDDLPIRFRDDGRGEQTFTWMFDYEKAARIRRVFGLIIETGWGSPVPTQYPTYFLDLAHNGGVYTARWDTSEENPAVVRLMNEHSNFWMMDALERQNLQTPEEIFAAYDKREISEPSVSEELHAGADRPDTLIFSARGFVEVIESAKREHRKLA